MIPEATHSFQVLCVAFVDTDDPRALGIARKLDGQVQAMSELGADVTYVRLRGRSLVVTEPNGQEAATGVRSQPLGLRSDFRTQVRRLCMDRHFDMVWMRAPTTLDPIILGILRDLRGSIRVLEMPTWPMRGVIAQQIKDLFQTHRFASLATRLLALILHFVSLPFARAVIDAVATYDDSSSIYGVGTICLTNGISPSETIPHSTRSLDEGLTLIGVAFIASWHGYDRVIRGLAQYREKTGPAALPVRFLIVGEGGEKDNLRQLCEAAGVSDLVEFTGPLSGLPLTEAYSSAQVGVGVLGLHRIGLEQAAALKHREYCLLGLPFIWSSHDGGIPDDFPFALHCAADDSPIDIGEVIAFVQSLPDDYQTTMHAFALKNLTWRTQFQTVFERLDLIRDPG